MNAALWAISPRHLQDVLAHLAGTPIRRIQPDATPASAAAAPTTTAAPRKPYHLAGRVAVIPVAGVMVPNADEAEELEWWGVAACNVAEARAAVYAAVSDRAVSALALDIDSPGGQVGGVSALADAVAAAGARKPTFAVVNDICASAAYWVGSQCAAMSATDTAEIGSIGVYSAFADLSRLVANVGVSVEVFASGPLKGAGVPGTSLSADQKRDIQARVDQLSGTFQGAVARGRRQTPQTVAGWATGGVYLAAEAQRMGLIDHVAGPDAALADLVRHYGAT